MSSTDVVALFPEYVPKYWKRRIEIYSEKLGLDGERKSDEKMRAGTRFEQAIAEEFADEMHVTLASPNQTFVRDEWMMATPDRLGPNFGLECKNVSESQAWLWPEPSEGEPPYHVLIQVGWNMAVLELPTWWVAACIGGWQFRFYRVERNPEFESTLIRVASEFWFNVVKKEAWSEGIPPDDSEAYGRFIKTLYPHPVVEQKVATKEIEDAYTRMLAFNRELEKLESEKKTAQNEVMAWMKDAGLVVTNRGDALFSFKGRKGYEVAAHTVNPSRVLRILNAKHQND
jgi:predicted phage-related endonuclease